MVQILTPTRQKPKTFAQSIVGGLAEGIPGAIDKFERDRITANENKSVNKLLGPGYENVPREFQQMAYQAKLNKQQREDELNFNLKKGQKEADVRKSLKNPNVQENTRDIADLENLENEVSSPREKVSKGNKTLEKEENTQSQLQPIKSPQQIKQEAAAMSQAYRDAGIYKDEREVEQELDQDNNRNIAHNQNIQTQEENKRTLQNRYGELGKSKIAQLLPDASQAIQNHFQAEGEELANSGKSEAEINKILSTKATDLKNQIAGIASGIGPKRTLNGIYRDIMGTSREAKAQFNDIKEKIQPLLDKGFNDEARNLLSGLGYEAEERESIISNLGETAKREIATLPKFSHESNNFLDRLKKSFKGESNYGPPQYSPENLEKINNSVYKILEEDPATNLILMRKAFQDKGVDWETFKNALNNAASQGKIKINQEQRNALNTLEGPPLDLLDSILNKFNFTGR